MLGPISKPTFDINIDDDEKANLVNVHDPFFLWALFNHSDRALIRSLSILSDADRSRLYWTCHYRKHRHVCQRILDDFAPVRIARDAMEKLSQLAKISECKTPNLSEIPIPFLLPTSPDFLVIELRDASYIPSKGRPLKFSVVDRKGNSKTSVFFFFFQRKFRFLFSVVFINMVTICYKMQCVSP